MLNCILGKESILTYKSDCLLLPISRVKKKIQLSPTIKAVDQRLQKFLSKGVIAKGDFTGQAGEVVWLYPPPPKLLPYRRILLVGLGDESDIEDGRLAIEAAFNAIGEVNKKTHNINHVVAAFDSMAASLLEYAIIIAYNRSYQFHLGGYFPTTESTLQKITFLPPPYFRDKQRINAEAIGYGMLMTRHLAEQPSNFCTPQFLAEVALTLSKKKGLKKLQCSVLDEKKIKALKMGGLLSVAQGSVNGPRFIIVKYLGGRRQQAPIVLVGKGVTFDTGGISIKPSANMDEMKFDMSGAATVLGVLLAGAQASLSQNIIGIIPACENMPDGKAIKPGDVIYTLSGKSVEVLNTDAEGRLILADALTYAQKFNPSAIIDIATLTGACLVALGNHRAGLMGRGEGLLSDLQAAGEVSGDLCWLLPMGKKYQDQLKTDYADVANIGGRYAGTITAACFLSRFVDCQSWAHLDIAGVAWTANKRATGRPVSLLMHYLLGRFK